MTTSKSFEGFSLSRAKILDGATKAENVTTIADDEYRLYGVSNASITPDTGNFDNTGDDAVLSTWYWFNFATITVEGGYIPFETANKLAGSTLTSSGSAPNDYYSLPLWEENSLNAPARPMLIRVPGKDADSNTVTLDFVLFKVQFSPISFNGPTYKSGLRVSYTGRALMSTKDEAGVTLANRAIGRILKRPGAV